MFQQDYSGNNYDSIGQGAYNPEYNGEYADFNINIKPFLVPPAAFRTAFSGLTNFSVATWYYWYERVSHLPTCLSYAQAKPSVVGLTTFCDVACGLVYAV